jgi:hypothetical protein
MSTGLNIRIATLPFFRLDVATKGLTALTPKMKTHMIMIIMMVMTSKIGYNKTVMGLPPITSAVYLIAKSFW